MPKYIKSSINQSTNQNQISSFLWIDWMVGIWRSSATLIFRFIRWSEAHAQTHKVMIRSYSWYRSKTKTFAENETWGDGMAFVTSAFRFDFLLCGRIVPVTMPQELGALPVIAHPIFFSNEELFANHWDQIVQWQLSALLLLRSMVIIFCSLELSGL